MVTTYYFIGLKIFFFGVNEGKTKVKEKITFYRNKTTHILFIVHEKWERNYEFEHTNLYVEIVYG